MQSFTCLFSTDITPSFKASARASTSVEGTNGLLIRALAHSKAVWLIVAPLGDLMSLKDMTTRSVQILLLPSELLSTVKSELCS